MTTASLLEQLRAQGAEIRLDGDQLTFRAPRGVVTPALREELRRRREEVRELLGGTPRPAEAPQAARDGDVAVVGLACRFPLAPDPDAFWTLLRDGVDAIAQVPPARRAAADQLVRLLPGADATTALPADLPILGSWLDGIESFDPLFFGISPREACVIDPQHRLFLEVAWEALEHAGRAGAGLAGSSTGVFVGVSHSDYLAVAFANGFDISGLVGTGNALCMTANRVSYILDLRGPSVAVDTACSSSLVALHLACQSLRLGQCRQAVAGGVNLILNPLTTLTFARAGMLSGDGRCKAFDARADGYVRGEGAGAVVLRPLADALAEGDHIWAVIRGAAVNHDGHSKIGLSAPSPRAQRDLVREAQRAAGVGADSISYVEAHGTGTALGDPVEIEGLTQAFASGTTRRGFCRIGTVKTNIGHLEAAAGIAGLVKVALALDRKQLPASLHFETPNPHIPFPETPFVVSRTLEPWDDAAPRRAAVSSFGFGGANAHVVVEEAPAPSRSAPAARPAYLLPLSARTPAALAELLARWEALLDSRPVELRDACWTASTGRRHFEHRLAIVASSTRELREALAALRGGEAAWTTAGDAIAYGVVRGRSTGPAVPLPGSGDAVAWVAALRAVAAGWVAGRPVDWEALHSGEDARRLPLPTTPFDRRRCWFDTVEDGAARPPAARATPVVSADEIRRVEHLLHETRWTPAPLPPARRDPGPATWLLLLDDGGVGEALAAHLERTARVVRVSRGSGFTAIGEARYAIDPAQPSHYGALAAALDTGGLVPDAVAHLWACDDAGEPADDAAALDRALDRGLHPLLLLTQALTARFRDAPMSLWTITTDAHAVPGSAQTRVSPAGAALIGFAKVIAKEYPRLRCAGVDLESAGIAPTLLARTVAAELAADGEPAWVAYRAGERLAPEVVGIERGVEAGTALPLREGGVYLVTGGQSGLGLEVARWIAQRVTARLVLVNRTPLDAAHAAGRRNAIADLERRGSSVLALAADVADEDAMRAVVERTLETFGRLDGVVHAAGVLRDHLVLNATRESFAEVLRPKVHGTVALSRVTAGHQLDFLVLFASMAATLAPAGQGNHVAANAFQDAWAAARPGTLVIDWGPWRDTGVVSDPRHQEALARRGVRALTTAEGLAALAVALASGRRQVGVFALGTDVPQRDAPPARPLDAIAASVRGELPRLAALYNLDRYRPFAPAIDRLALTYVVEAFSVLGWRPAPGERVERDALAERLGITPTFTRLLDRMLGMLIQDDVLRAGADGELEVVNRPALAPAAEQLAGLRVGFPALDAELSLLARCGERLAQVMTGAADPIAVLMPGGKLDALEALYEDSPFCRVFNSLVAKAVGELTQDLPADRTLRVVEIGAGTGATTAAILPRLAASRTEYWFTDLSRLFLRRASEKLAGFSFVRHALLDIEQPPASQGIEAGAADVVVAANVLHATADVGRSLAHARALLRPGGTLVLLEATRATRWLDLVFGLLDGWRRFTDEERRGDTPLLDDAAWRALLSETGFVEVTSFPTADDLGDDLGDDPGQAVLLARVAGGSARDGCASPAAPGAPDDARAWRGWVEERIVAHLARSLALDTAEIATRRTFVELGLDSLLAVEIAGKLGAEIALEVSPVALFEHPSPAELAGHLASLTGRAPGPAPAPAASAPPSATTLLAMYEALPPSLQRRVDEAATSAEADRLIVDLTAGA